MIKSHPKDKHPLLISIENPINRFCDDFASCLADEPFGGPNQAHKEGQRDIDLGEYEIVSLIGGGASATVWCGRKKGTAFEYAIKKYKPNADLNFHEYKVSERLNHPHCIRIEDYLEWSDGTRYIMMPLAPGGCLSLQPIPQLTVNMAIMLLYQIGSGLAHMHSQNIVHRDVKPDNILVFEDGFRICDYSMAMELSQAGEKIVGVAGTPVFMAPEMSNEIAYDPMAVDMWAVGVTVYGLLFGVLPWTLGRVMGMAVGVQNVAQKEIRGNLTFPNAPRVPERLREILERLLTVDPQKRMTAQQLWEDPWIENQMEQWRNVIGFVEGERRGNVNL